MTTSSGRSAGSAALVSRNSSCSCGLVAASADSLTSSPCSLEGVFTHPCTVEVTGHSSRFGSLVSPDTDPVTAEEKVPPAVVHGVPADALFHVAVAGSKSWVSAWASKVAEPLVSLNQPHSFSSASVIVAPDGIPALLIDG